MEIITETEMRACKVCLGCGIAKDQALVVCWGCFKGRTRVTPYKYWSGSNAQWIAKASERR